MFFPNRLVRLTNGEADPTAPASGEAPTAEADGGAEARAAAERTRERDVREARLAGIRDKIQELRGLSAYFGEAETGQQIAALEREAEALQAQLNGQADAAPSTAPGAAPERTEEQMKAEALRHNKVKTALLLLKSKKENKRMAAENDLNDLIANRPRPADAVNPLMALAYAEAAEDPYVWLALSRAYEAQGKMPEMLRAFEFCLAHGGRALAQADPSARQMIERIEANMALVVIRKKQGPGEENSVNLPISLRGILFSPERNRLYDGLIKGDRGNARISATPDQPFYLPIGKYTIGGQKVDVKKGETAFVDLPETEPPSKTIADAGPMAR